MTHAGGRIVILDSAFYAREADGEQMLMEKRRDAAARFGERADVLMSAPVHRVSHAGSPRGGVRTTRARVDPAPRALSALVRASTIGGATSRTSSAIAFRPLGGSGLVILFVNPRATRPSNRRFPLSIMAVGAALSDDESWEIVDGNLPNADVTRRAVGSHRCRAAERRWRARGGVHRHARAAARECGAPLPRPEGALSADTNRVGRQLSESLPGADLECTVH